MREKSKVRKEWKINPVEKVKPSKKGDKREERKEKEELIEEAFRELEYDISNYDDEEEG